MHLPRRMETLSAPGVFTVLAEKKRELLSRGADVMDLSVGSPDNAPPAHVVEAMRKGLEEPECFRYAIADLPELRSAAAGWYLRRYGVRLDPEREIASLLGSQDGLGHMLALHGRSRRRDTGTRPRLSGFPRGPAAGLRADFPDASEAGERIRHRPEGHPIGGRPQGQADDRLLPEQPYGGACARGFLRGAREVREEFRYRRAL